MDFIIGDSQWACRTRGAIEQVADRRSSVLITGPSGTGKELIAQAIHRHSARSKAPFVPVDCTAIPPSLFASQLFGHVKGSFSGAECDTLGSFRAADEGSIFLDEIGELSPDLQAQLLRVIQQRAVIPVGSHRGVPIDVRIIAATNRDLAAEVQLGRFRLDLYYRLNVVKFETTPLRDRPEDIEPLCRHFLDKFAIENGLSRKRLGEAALRLLEKCDWPGNVRQLQNLLERVVVFSEADEITGHHIVGLLDSEDSPFSAANHETAAASAPGAFDSHGDDTEDGFVGPKPGAGAWPTLAELESQLIQATLRRTYNNQSAAARLLDVDRRLLARKIRKHGIAVPSRRHRVRSV